MDKYVDFLNEQDIFLIKHSSIELYFRKLFANNNCILENSRIYLYKNIL